MFARRSSGFSARSLDSARDFGRRLGRRASASSCAQDDAVQRTVHSVQTLFGAASSRRPAFSPAGRGISRPLRRVRGDPSLRLRSLALLGISARGSDAAQTPQAALGMTPLLFALSSAETSPQTCAETFALYSSGNPLSIAARTFSIRLSRSPKSCGSIGGWKITVAVPGLMAKRPLGMM